MAENWNWDITKHQEVMAKALTTGFKSDVAAVVLIFCDQALWDFCQDFTQPDNRYLDELRVNGFILSIFSPVLCALIKSAQEKKCLIDLIFLGNVDPTYFNLLLKYMYTGESGVSMLQALPLLAMATKYKVAGCIEECSKLLGGDLTLENAVPIFQEAMDSVHPDLIVSSLDFICKFGSKILNSEDFLGLRLECLVEIVKQDSLEVKNEMEVYDAVCRWGEAEAKRQNLDPALPDTMKKILEKALKYVRFPQMDQTEFAISVASKPFLLDAEKLKLFVYFTIPQNKRSVLPEGAFISTPRKYIKNEIVIVYRECIDPDAYTTCEELGIKEPLRMEEVLMVKVSAPIFLHGIMIYKGTLGDDYKDSRAQIIISLEGEHYTAPDIIPSQEDEEVKLLLPIHFKLEQDKWARINFSLDGFIKERPEDDNLYLYTGLERLIDYQHGEEQVLFNFKREDKNYLHLETVDVGFIMGLIVSFQ